MIPGEYILATEDIELNVGRPMTTLNVSNTGDRPIQIGSHYHFAEVNRALSFPREMAWGQHLHLAAGTSARFEPGETRSVTLVPFAGNRIIFGHSGLVEGPLDTPGARETGIARLRAAGFKDTFTLESPAPGDSPILPSPPEEKSR